MKNVLVFLMVALFTGEVRAQVVVDVMKIAGKTEKEVTAYLGEPLSCAAIKCGPKCVYAKGETEIVFVDGKADWITVDAMDHMSFSPSALSALGLVAKKPDFLNPKFVYRWYSFPGVLDVSIFRGKVNTDYAYIQVNNHVASKQCPLPVKGQVQASVASSDDQTMPENMAQIQLGAYGSSQMAYDAWGQIKNTAPEDIRELTPDVIKVSYGGRDFYRLRVGPIVNPKAVCDALRAKRQACIEVPD
ncbi:SPOR domain-containing protein [Kordiimonas sp.]|uniref:SPOR domain-containing protein n=1 Tax=Kordiimonas sp. TaxID=1970157 RepID=UPI003B526727